MAEQVDLHGGLIPVICYSVAQSIYFPFKNSYKVNRHIYSTWQSFLCLDTAHFYANWLDLPYTKPFTHIITPYNTVALHVVTTRLDISVISSSPTSPMPSLPYMLVLRLQLQVTRCQVDLGFKTAHFDHRQNRFYLFIWMYAWSLNLRSHMLWT